MTPERRQELLDSITKMQSASDQFYANAIKSGHHAFIEFTGLMNEYIKICTQSLEEGIDFTECNVHCGGSFNLVMHSFQKSYLSEKLECIFEGTGLSFTAS